VVLGLGDLFHANDHKASTPKSHHHLDVDGRWQKVFSAGARLMTNIIAMVAAKHPETEVVFLPGNHDPDASVCLTVAMELFYDRHPGITVNTTPAMAWFRRFGKNLIGATHGHTMPKERAAMIMATDRAEDWGLTKHRHMLTGHIHHETLKEVAGVRVESFQAPAAKDSYNAGAGYRAGRSMVAITYHNEDGEIGRHRVNI
jgi:UDP-2,3-diacylglucosamine pyrophosphatase LpxH